MNKLIFLSMIILWSCKTSKNITETPVPFENLGQGALYGNGKEGFLPKLYVIDNPTEWAEFLQKMNTVNDESKKLKTTQIDFDQKMVLALFDRVLGSGGAKIQIEKITETPDEIHVYARHIAPQGSIGTMVMNQPYHIISTKKINKKVVLLMDK